MCEKRDFSVNKHRMVTTYSNTYFEEKFGRNDFEPIDSCKDLGGSIAYITKYIEKTGERIMYTVYVFLTVSGNRVINFFHVEETS